MSIKVKVSNFSVFNFSVFKKNIDLNSIELDFYGTISTGEKVSFNGRYNFNGELIWCSSPYSSCNCPDYYIEISEYFKLIKDYQGENVLNIIDQLIEIIKPLQKEADEIGCKVLEMARLVNTLKKEYEENLKTLKRLRNKEKIKNQQEIVNIAKESYFKILEEFENLNSRSNDIYQKMKDKTIIGIQ